MSGRQAKQPKVTRYRAGYIPSHAKDQVDESVAALENKKSLSFGPRRDELPNHADRQRRRAETRASPSPPRSRRQRTDPEKSTKNQPPSEVTEDDEIHIPQRSRVTPQLLDVDNDDKIVGMSSDEESDDDEAMQRRRRIRAQMAAEIEEKEDQAQAVREQYASRPQEPSDEESSEWETDSDAEEEEFNAYKDRLRAHAPVFVSKEQRATVVTEEDEEVAAEKEEKEKLEKQEQRKEETKTFLKDAVVSVADESNNGNELSDEEGDPKEEYEKWKQRELSRIVKEYQERHPECLDAENQASGKKKERSKDGNKMRYMQKYYHKGAFYQDEELLQRDYTAPTLEDKMDITLLPKVMQVKNFGKAGRTKYTHLADVDTTDRSAGWADSRKRSSRHSTSPPPKRRK